MTHLDHQLAFKIFFCLIIQVLVLFVFIEISKLFKFNFIRNKKFFFFFKSRTKLFYVIFIVSYVFLSIFLNKIKGNEGIQIANFFFFFITCFDSCIKIGKSSRFSDWLGVGIDETFRIFIMFIISLNIIYFLTRITYSITQVN